jgi:hypothetical protein
MFHQVLLSRRKKNFSFLFYEIFSNILTDDSCSSICKSLSRSSILNDERFVLLIDEPFDGIGTSSNIGRLARFGNPATVDIAPSVVRLFVEVLADETAGFSGLK